MCGIFGFATEKSQNISETNFKKLVKNFILKSESRGKEAVGLAAITDKTIRVIKRPWSGGYFLRSAEFTDYIDRLYADQAETNSPLVIIGHCRLVTNGSSHLHQNNQPVIEKGIVGIHNGIIVNAENIYSGNTALKRDFDVDSEVILDLIQYHRGRGNNISDAIKLTFETIKGEASVATLFSDLNVLAIMTNNGSLYYSPIKKYSSAVFASEKFILENVMNELDANSADIESIKKVEPKSGVIFDYSKQPNPLEFKFSTPQKTTYSPLKIVREIEDARPVPVPTKISTESHLENEKLLLYDEKWVRGLKRCTKCLLPYSFPFITFDKSGVCNYCHAYKPVSWKGIEAFKRDLTYSRKKKPKILLALSGGRDSCYALHFLKKELDLDIIAYTYDWGMVTDLARRNMSRMCAELEVEHILVSADIARKRENIRKNVLAWLNRPHLGMVPLFMAGDKQFFYYANKVMEQNSLDSMVFGMNPLEKTDFKVGFCGISKNNVNRHYHLDLLNQFKILKFYLSEFLLNPGYINTSIFDTLFAYFSYYVSSHNYLILYQYLKWNEPEIVDTLIKQYDWEVASDTKTTWRIGDGTASFYNYIYFSVAGFSESETFRSNQIREGTITRSQGLDFVVEENRPRYESIKWYCDTNGLEFVPTICRINEIRKLYR